MYHVHREDLCILQNGKEFYENHIDKGKLLQQFRII